MIKDFVALPDQRIRQKSQEVLSFDKPLAALIDDLIETAQAQKNPPALGLAACQIGVAKRVFVAKIQNRRSLSTNKFRAFVNARIVKKSKNQTPLLEGCFSATGIYGHVTRPAEIAVEAQNKSGKKITKTYKGLPAKIIQHEIDHADGVLFIDHVYDQNGKLFRIEKDKEGKEQLIEISYV